MFLGEVFFLVITSTQPVATESGRNGLQIIVASQLWDKFGARGVQLLSAVSTVVANWPA